MKVYCVYRKIGDDYDVVRIFANESKAEEFVNMKNSADTYGWRWFLQETEVVQ